MRQPYHDLHRPGGNVQRVVLGRKHCPGCGRWRHLCDFQHRSGRPGPRCYCCQRAKLRERWRTMSRPQRDLRNEYLRFRTEAYARAAGRAYHPRTSKRMRTRQHNNGVSNPRIVAQPLVDAIESYAVDQGWDAEINRMNGTMDSEFTIDRIAEAAGVSTRMLYAIRSGERQLIRLDSADRLAVAIGHTLWTIDADWAGA